MIQIDEPRVHNGPVPRKGEKIVLAPVRKATPVVVQGALTVAGPSPEGIWMVIDHENHTRFVYYAGSDPHSDGALWQERVWSA